MSVMSDLQKAWLNWSNLPVQTCVELSRRAVAERFWAVGREMPTGLDTPGHLWRACEEIVPLYVPRGIYTGRRSINTFTIDRWRRVALRTPDSLGIGPASSIAAYGRARRGDYAPLGFFEELYRAINALTWTKRTFAFDPQGEPNRRTGGGGFARGEPLDYEQSIDSLIDAAMNGGTVGPDPGELLIGALEVYDAATTEPYWGTVAGAPRAYALTGHRHDSCHAGHAMNVYDIGVGVEGVYSYGLINSIPAYIAHSVDWMAQGWIDSGNADPSDGLTPGPGYGSARTYSPQGTGLPFRAFGIFGTSGPEKIEEQYSPQLGSHDHPALEYPPFSAECDNTTPSWESSNFNGYYAALPTAILKWAGEGGMIFADTSDW